jgi:diguanylate cyclase (GGDEF)-like protein
VARYGGDEFLLMMPDTGREGAEALLERLKCKVKEAKLPPSVSVGLDFGVASFPEDGMSFASVVQIADQRLYASKTAQQSVSAGRGR